MHNHTARLSLLCLLALALIVSACNFPQPTPETDAGNPNAVQTFAAQTVAAMGTEMVIATLPPATLAPPAVVTATQPAPAEPTQAPATAAPTAASTVEPTENVPCDRARFVRDVTVPDGTVFNPGTKFTKTWELENTGSCTWTSSYALVFANEGNAMNGPASTPLTSGSVAPGAKVQVSVELTAPNQPGEHRGYWLLRNNAGVVFGTGDNNDPFYVEIEVPGTQVNWMNDLCKAEWRSGAGVLTCPSASTTDANGVVTKVQNPRFGSGTDEDEEALLLIPQAVDNGEIRGAFPQITVGAGARLRGFVGCQRGADACDVKVLVLYKVDGGAEQTLKEWSVKYTNFVNLDTDLASLTGKNVQFILVVRANGSANQDQVLLLQPRVSS